MSSFEDYKVALEAREVFQALILETLEEKRPGYRYATVASINRTARTATVTYPEGGDPATVAMGAVQPSVVGQVVRIEGRLGDKFIADVMGPAYIAAEAWLQPGTPGQPAFSTGWANYADGNFTPIRFRKEGGVVHIVGMAARSSGTNSTIFTLPVGYRPPTNLIFSTFTSSGPVRFDVTAAGAVDVGGSGLPSSIPWISITVTIPT